MKYSILIALAFMGSIRLYSQGTVQISERVGKLILKDLSELDMRRRLAVSDSLSIQELTKAYYYKDSALNECEVGLKVYGQLVSDNQALVSVREKELKESRKEIAKQKRLKWLGFLLIPVAVILMAH